jgi:hypothetical protein
VRRLETPSVDSEKPLDSFCIRAVRRVAGREQNAPLDSPKSREPLAVVQVIFFRRRQ